MRIETVHIADMAFLGKAMDHRDIVFMPGRQHHIQHVEIGGIAETKPPAQLILIVFT